MVDFAVGVSMCVLTDVSRFGEKRLLISLIVNCNSALILLLSLELRNRRYWTNSSVLLL